MIVGELEGCRRDIWACCTVTMMGIAIRSRSCTAGGCQWQWRGHCASASLIKARLGSHPDRRVAYLFILIQPAARFVAAVRGLAAASRPGVDPIPKGRLSQVVAGSESLPVAKVLQCQNLKKLALLTRNPTGSTHWQGRFLPGTLYGKREEVATTVVHLIPSPWPGVALVNLVNQGSPLSRAAAFAHGSVLSSVNFKLKRCRGRIVVG